MKCIRRTTKQVFALAFISAIALWGCSRSSDVLDPKLLEEKYGVSGAYADQIATPDGPMQATIVPVTLANGQRAHLIIPKERRDPVYMRDQTGIHPVVLSDRNVSREEFVRSKPTIVERRAAPPDKKKRSWEKDVLIVGGSAGAGAAIGAAAGGKKGAGIGALSGGVAGLLYDLATRNK
ncbi:MAG: hypothetical protein HY644_03925 [Acidobacteria bacterium]|nr:hypothetical protein [Acidobacteriota bacterium]